MLDSRLKRTMKTPVSLTEEHPTNPSTTLLLAGRASEEEGELERIVVLL
jgi:hypothetical protein